MKTRTEWKASDTAKAVYLGLLEIESAPADFVIMELPDRLVFGGTCNAGFLESGYMPKEDGETRDAALAELQADLEVFYLDGANATSRIVHNERM